MQEYALQRAPLRPHRTGKPKGDGATAAQRKALGLPPASAAAPAPVPAPPRKKPAHASRRR